MNAVRLTQLGKPLESQQVPIPSPRHGEVLVRVKAAGICHSDAHYRAGRSPVRHLPTTLGHEVAGILESTGAGVTEFRPGDRVCLHYLATCGECGFCRQGHEQFCPTAEMMGKHRDGGFAEFVAMPARSTVRLPAEVPFEHGAIMMCSSATALHALNKARLRPGETVAVFGVGGLGVSAIQLAQAMGARQVFAVDLKPGKLALAQGLGAVPVNAGQADPVTEILRLTGGRGADVALELIGLPLTMQQAVSCLAVQGRAALAGITERSFDVSPYHQLINKEAEIIGVSDHLGRELPGLVEWARQGRLALGSVVTRSLPLDAAAINNALDRLEGLTEELRMVVVP